MGLGNPSEEDGSIAKGERFHESTAKVERSSARYLGLAGSLLVATVLLLFLAFLVRR